MRLWPARRWLRPCLLLVAGAAQFSILAGRPEAQSSREDREEPPEIRKLTLRGVRAVDENELRETITTGQSRCRLVLVLPFCLVARTALFIDKRHLDRETLAQDVVRIRAVYWKHGYRAARVSTAVRRHGGGVSVTFRVSEGPPTLLSSVTVRRVGSVPSGRELRRTIQLRAGQPLDLSALDSSLARLKNLLWDHGYADAQVSRAIELREGGATAAVRISIDPKWRTTVGAIRVRGNARVAEQTVRSALAMRPGDPYRRRDVLASQRFLYQSELFTRAVVLVPPSGDSVKQLEVIVQERPARRLRTAVGFNTVEFGQIAGRVTHSNVGDGRRLDVQAAVANLLAPQLNGAAVFRDVTPTTLSEDDERGFLRPIWQASLTLRQPWVGSPRNSIGASVFGHRRSVPGTYIERGVGATATFTRELAARVPVSASYRFEVARVEAGDVYFCQSYGICDPATANSVRGRNRLSPLSLSAWLDRSDVPSAPTRGYTVRLDVEHASAWTASDYRYTRAFGEASAYRSLGRRSILVARVRAGWVRPLGSTGEAVGAPEAGDQILHPRKRFYAGGAQSVRGYGENELGPTVLRVDAADLIRAGCAAASIADRSCDPNGAPARVFRPRALGGSSLLEGSVEWRFELRRKLGAVVFADAAVVGAGPRDGLSRRAGSITPGIGLRYLSGVGPLRLDFGLRPTLRERLPVVLEEIDDSGTTRVVRLNTLREHDRLQGVHGTLRRIMRRLTLHFSFGQAF